MKLKKKKHNSHFSINSSYGWLSDQYFIIPTAKTSLIYRVSVNKRDERETQKLNKRTKRVEEWRRPLAFVTVRSVWTPTVNDTL